MTRHKSVLVCAVLAFVSSGWVLLAPADTPDGRRPAAGAARASGHVPAAIPADTPVRMTTVAHLGGYANAVAGVRDHALLGESGHLVSVNLADPGAPRAVWRSTEFGEEVRQVHVDGDLALVPGPALRVFNVADPAAPRELGVFAHLPSRAVATEATTAYLLGASALWAVDLTIPAAPRELGQFEGLTEGLGIAVNAGIVWVADWSDGLRAVDARDPTAMRQLSLTGSEAGIGHAMCVAAAGSRVVVSGMEPAISNTRGIVAVFDAADPSAPRRIGLAYTGRDIPGKCRLADGRLFYVAEDQAGVAVYNVSGDGAPVLLARLTTPAGATDVSPMGDHTLVTDSAAYVRDVPATGPQPGLHLFQGTAEIGSLASLTNLTAIAAAGSHAYVAGATSGLHILAVADASRPIESGRIDTTGPAASIVVDGALALVAEAPGQLVIYDVSAQSEPRRLSTLRVGQPERALAARDGIALVPDGLALVVIDYTTPSAPREAGRITLESGPVGLALDGHLALVAEERRGLQLVDVTRPDRPAKLGYLAPDSWYAAAQAVAVEGNLAYLGERVHGAYFIPTPVPPTPGPSPTGTPATPTPAATAPPDGGRLTMVDIADPAAPRALGRTSGFYSRPIDVVRPGGGRAWLVDGPVSGWRSVMAVDVSDPARPTELNLQFEPPLPDPLQPNDLAVDGEYVYLAARAGLLVLRAERPAAVVPRVWLPWAQR